MQRLTTVHFVIGIVVMCLQVINVSFSLLNCYSACHPYLTNSYAASYYYISMQAG